MDAFYHVWLVVTDHGYAAVIEFIVDMGDQVVTHLVYIIVLKSGVIVGWRAVKHVRNRNTVKPLARKAPVGHKRKHTIK